MGLLTTYVCDCCGAMSPQRDEFGDVPATFAVAGSWTVSVAGPLLCNPCINQISLAVSGAVSALKGSASGTTLQE